MSREIVGLVLVEAVGSSMTPFVPVPFVDDYLVARLLRRITRKVTEHGGQIVDKAVAKAIVEGYTRAGDVGVGEKALTTAARFVARKVAVVLDVKKSHDVFGEAIAYALALDVAVRATPIQPPIATPLGGALFRATESVGSAALEVLTRAGREAWSASRDAPRSSRFGRVADAVGRRVEETRVHLERVMHWELARLAAR